MWKSLIVAGLFCVSGCDLSVPQNTSTTQQAKPNGITKAHYDQIQSGMTYSECVRVLGRSGEEVSRTDFAGNSSAIYVWKNPFGSNVTITFSNGKVMSKAQFGL